MLVAILHFVTDADNPRALVSTLLDALPSGSYLVASHATAEHDPVAVRGLEQTYRAAGVPAQARDHHDFAEIAFTSLRLVEPGVVSVSEWRPDESGLRPSLAEVNWYGGVARKP
jgi:hypothetical protein